MFIMQLDIKWKIVIEAQMQEMEEQDERRAYVRWAARKGKVKFQITCGSVRGGCGL